MSGYKQLFQTFHRIFIFRWNVLDIILCMYCVNISTIFPQLAFSAPFLIFELRWKILKISYQDLTWYRQCSSFRNHAREGFASSFHIWCQRLDIWVNCVSQMDRCESSDWKKGTVYTDIIPEKKFTSIFKFGNLLKRCFSSFSRFLTAVKIFLLKQTINKTAQKKFHGQPCSKHKISRNHSIQKLCTISLVLRIFANTQQQIFDHNI